MSFTTISAPTATTSTHSPTIISWPQYKTDWGEAINFDGPNGGPVREFFIANAGYWIEEFHFDGLRLDATQHIYDDSPEHILAAIGGASAKRRPRAARRYRRRKRAAGRSALCARWNKGGFGLDALVERRFPP